METNANDPQESQGVEAQSWLSKAIGVDIKLKDNPLTGAVAKKIETEAIVQLVKNLDNDTLRCFIQVAQDELSKRK